MNALGWWVTSLVLPLVVTEITELGPWMARRVIAVASRLVVPRELGLRLKEEWLAGVDEWPGKLTKLIRALSLVLVAVPRIDYDYFDRWWQRTIGARVGVFSYSRNLRMFLRASWVVRFGAPPVQRRKLNQFNEMLTDVFRLVRSDDPTQRTQALEMLNLLVSEPPYWVRWLQPWMQAMIRRDYRRLVETVELRYA